jgi:hypothetical protein
LSFETGIEIAATQMTRGGFHRLPAKLFFEFSNHAKDAIPATVAIAVAAAASQPRTIANVASSFLVLLLSLYVMLNLLFCHR